MGRVVDVVAGLLLGAGCAGCGGTGVPLCPRCSAALRRPPHATEPEPAPPGFPPTWTTAAYAGVVRRTLLAHKEGGRLALARPLGLALAAAVGAALGDAEDDPVAGARAGPGLRVGLVPVPSFAGARAGSSPRVGLVPIPSVAGARAGPGLRVWLVPVPSSRAAVRARGHDALLRTARCAAGVLRGAGVAAGVLPLLRHRRRVADSAGLTSEQRRTNLADSLWVPPALRPLLAGGRVVVVDDVVTTGATLTEAARALATAGCRDVRAATVAATQRRPPRTGGLRPRAPPDSGVLPDPEALASVHGTVRALARAGRSAGAASGCHRSPRAERPGTIGALGTRLRSRADRHHVGTSRRRRPGRSGGHVDIVVTARHCELKERFRAHVTEKLARLEKLEHRALRIDVEVSREPNPRLADVAERVELTVHSKGPVIRAEAQAADRYAALDTAVERLEARLRKVADRRRVHRGSRTPVSVAQATAGLDGAARLGARTASVPSSDGVAADGEASSDAALDGARSRSTGPLQVDGDGPLVVREKTHQASPMSLDQALYEMELVGHDFYLFVDADSERPSVVYRRRGYDYGVIHLDV